MRWWWWHHHHLIYLLLLTIPSSVKLQSITTDLLILPVDAQSGYILLEETLPSRSKEFSQCLQQNTANLPLAIDPKYGDLIINGSIGNIPLNEQRLLCTIQRNQVRVYHMMQSTMHVCTQSKFVLSIIHMQGLFAF